MKKIVIPILTLIAGLLIGYYYCKKNATENNFTDGKQLTKEGQEFIEKFYADSAFVFNEGSRHISEKLARTLIKAYQDQNKGFFPLKNPKKELLNGYYIDRGPLDTILKNKAFTGINIYFAKDSTAHVDRIKGRIYTLVYMGSTENKLGRTVNGEIPRYINDTNRENGGGAYDFVKPCPDACGNFLKKEKE